MIVSSPARRGRRVFASAATAVVLFLAATAAGPGPTTAAAASSSASKRCPTVGRTLAFERYDKTVTSRIWRTRGRTYGCTLVGSKRPKTHLLTRAKTGLLRLENDTVAWTTPRNVGGVASARVSMYDLTDGARLISSARAVPRRSADGVQQEGTVDQLRVSTGLFVTWVANGDTVVVGAYDPGELTLLGSGGPDADRTPLYLDGPLAVAGSYAPSPDLAKQLIGSLAFGFVPGDHGDSDDCAYSYETAFVWSTGPGSAFEARMRGTRVTPETCR